MMKPIILLKNDRLTGNPATPIFFLQKQSLNGNSATFKKKQIN
jgi:hypothetical protein